MARDLISREALYDAMREKEWQNWPPLDEIDAVIEKAPAVDAVEVVRCKECVHAGAFPNNYAARRFEGGMNCYLCRGDDGYGIANVSVVYPDDYCSDGVRREKKDGTHP